VQQNRVGEQNLYSLFGLFSLAFILLVPSLGAKSFEDFKRVQNISFDNYKDKRDSEFSKYLKVQWNEYISNTPFKLYEKQKPKSLVSTFQKSIKSVGPSISIFVKKTDDNLSRYIKLHNDKKDIRFDFFGQDVGFNVDIGYKSAKYYPQNQLGVSNFFSVVASSEYGDLLDEIDSVIDNLKLNDWGIYQLITRISQKIYISEDDRKLFVWFMMTKMGYDIKIGLYQKHIILMFYSKDKLYLKANFIFNKKRFYVISEYANENIEKVYTYNHIYPGAIKPLKFKLNELPHFQRDIHTKTLTFKEFGKIYDISYRYDKNLIDFMATYPQVDYKIYFNTPMSSITLNDIVASMKKYIDNKKASSAINFVLHFVQKSFKYERDQEQFGKEKVMFADEVLFYKKSDCEDRVILFSHLIKDIFHFSVAGLKYKDHMSSGLYIPMNGDSVRVAGRRFVVADPTYINANVGQSMSKYKNKAPISYVLVK